MSEYVFLYRGAERPTSPQDAQPIMQKWIDWLEDLGKKGHIRDRGQPLEPTGKVVAGKQKTVTDGPFAEAKDLVGGYSLIEANDLALAEDVVQDAFYRALEVWKFRGMPENPSAWLTATAKNRAALLGSIHSGQRP